jgi:hypothetical protein
MEITARTVAISLARANRGLTAPSRKVLQSSTWWARRARRGQTEPNRHGVRDRGSLFMSGLFVWPFGWFAKTESHAELRAD